MIDLDFQNYTYTCPYCGSKQAYRNSYSFVENGNYQQRTPIPQRDQESSYRFYTLYCTNTECRKITVVGINRTSQKQIDIVPEAVVKNYPNYIPEQIRKDYEEAARITALSPRAAATLLRRCLQGMIHDFWNIHEKNLNAEITSLKDKIPCTQWNAIDGIRKIGNIGAHMEHDIDRIIDIDPNEAQMLLQLIELLLDKWYISRHDEENLMLGIASISAQKEAQRKE